MCFILQSTPTNDIFNLLQFGVLGIVLLALILGYLWTRPSVQTILDQAESLREEAKALREELMRSNNHTREMEEIRRHLASIDKRLEQMERERVRDRDR